MNEGQQGQGAVPTPQPAPEQTPAATHTTEPPIPQDPQPAATSDPAPAPQPAADPQAWYAGLPQEMHGQLAQFKTVDDLMAVVSRGIQFAPAASVEDYKLNVPAGVAINKAQHDEFKALCHKEGIPVSMAQKLLDWDIERNTAGIQAALAYGDQELTKLWGADKDKNKEKALQFLTTLDRKMGGRLAPTLDNDVLMMNPSWVEALHLLGGIISEDSLGGAAAASGTVTETPEQTYQKLFANSKG